jgi:tripartite-type tricarboxylate transporter receptor subunit TctC
MTFASSGAGTVVHLAGELFKSQTKAAIRHVPYNAVSPAEVDIMAGRVTMMFDSLPVALPYIKDGKMKALGVTTRNRSIFAPEIPSLAEQGIADFDVSSWYAIWAPSALPNDITNVLNKAINDALVNPEFAARLTIMGGEAFGRSPADADKFVREELAKWTSAVELLGPRSN